MANFEDLYTTAEKISADSLKKPEEQTKETSKTQLSNDAYAVGSVLALCADLIERLRMSLNK